MSGTGRGGGSGSSFASSSSSDGGSSSSFANGSSGSSGGGGGGSSSFASGGVVSPSGLAVPSLPSPAPRGSGAGMTGFAEAGASEFAFAAGSVLGLRQWTLTSPDFRGDPHNAASNWPVVALRGATGYSWPPGVLEAQCNNGYPHPPPTDVDPNTGSRCGCGCWAYWDMEALAVSHSVTTSGNSLPVLGVIEGYGRVLLGSSGFRSQKAKIVALAPAFAIQTELSPRRYGRIDPASDADPYLAYAEQRKTEERAQQHADAWLAMIQDRLGTLYPGAQVFATAGGLLACVQTRGKPS